MKKLLYLVLGIILVLVVAVASMVRFDIPVDKLKAKYADANSKFVNIDGLSVHYRDEGKGEPIVLLHGAASSLQTWDGWANLSKGYRVIRLDLPGYGLTGPNNSKDYSMGWYVRFLDTFLNKLDIKNCYMAGNSFGGHIAIEYAFQNKGRVKKLVLVDSGGYLLPDAGILATKMARSPVFRPLVRYATPRFFVSMNLKEAYGKGQIADDVIDRYYELLLREGNRQTFIAVENSKAEDSADHIKALRVPTLILWGKSDRIIPVEYAERFHRDIRGSRVIFYDGVGHIPNEELPDKTAEDVRAFLKEAGS